MFELYIENKDYICRSMVPDILARRTNYHVNKDYVEYEHNSLFGQLFDNRSEFCLVKQP